MSRRRIASGLLNLKKKGMQRIEERGDGTVTMAGGATFIGSQGVFAPQERKKERKESCLLRMRKEASPQHSLFPPLAAGQVCELK